MPACIRMVEAFNHELSRDENNIARATNSRIVDCPVSGMICHCCKSTVLDIEFYKFRNKALKIQVVDSSWPRSANGLKQNDEVQS